MYRPGGGPSRATASTQCQKCLKRGHYSYECKAVAQERPYVSRPSRTQQLANPKLVPKLSEDFPQDLLRKKGIADEELAKKEAEREKDRKRDRDDDESPERDIGASKRRRSLSSSVSVSTISTRSSRSRSPPQSTAKAVTRIRSPSPRAKPKRRRDSVSPALSYDSSGHDRAPRPEDRSTRRRYSQASPPARGRQIGRSEGSKLSMERSYSRNTSGDRRRSVRDSSRSPRRERGRKSDERGAVQETNGRPRAEKDNAPEPSNHSTSAAERRPVKKRSLSPFSKRLALTKEMHSR